MAIPDFPVSQTPPPGQDRAKAKFAYHRDHYHVQARGQRSGLNALTGDVPCLPCTGMGSYPPLPLSQATESFES